MDHLSGLVFRRPQATLTADLWSIFAPPFSPALLTPAEGYPWAFRRFAQDALSRFDMALLAAALQGFRGRFRVAVG